jgi:hypothetical protein
MHRPVIRRRHLFRSARNLVGKPLDGWADERWLNIKPQASDTLEVL